MNRPIARTTLPLLLVAAFASAACEDGGTDLSASAQTRVTLSSSGGAARAVAAALLSGASFSSSTQAGPPDVALGAVKSIDIRIASVQVLPAGRDTGQEAGWMSLALADSARRMVNLLALPDSAVGGLTLARGTLPAGNYEGVRLIVDSATITLKQDVRINGGGREGTTFRANTAYALTIPSAAQSGIKIPTARFTVGADSAKTVRVLFNAPASFADDIRVRANPNGIRLQPVVHARTESQRDDRRR